MSDEYHFGVGNGKVSGRKALALDRVANLHGAFFTAVDLPEGPRYWFGCKNLGEPFDSQRAGAVLHQAKQRGLWPIK